MNIWICLYHWKKKLSHFDLKSWVIDRGTKIWSEIPSNWRILESNSLDIESKIVKFDSKYRVHQWLNFLGQNDSIFSSSVYLLVSCI